MLKRIDRLQMAVPDRDAVAKGWSELLGAEPAGEDRVASLSARRTRLRLGSGFVELLEPDGAGRIGDAVAKRGAHLYAAGAATDDFAALVAHLRSQGIDPVEEGDAFVPIDSKHYGYAGTLTLFDRDRLGRFEVITPHDPRNTMGRFFSRFGESFYMAFAESHALGAIEARAREIRAGHTPEPPSEGRVGDANTVFLHPAALGGMMLGLSRPTQAWQWSGHPERVEPRPRA
ncbi:MAG: VOC family protein [Myxococcota bacterium]